LCLPRSTPAVGCGPAMKMDQADTWLWHYDSQNIYRLSLFLPLYQAAANVRHYLPLL